jgi:hypothetical protein
MADPIPWHGSTTFPALAQTASGNRRLGAPSRLANLRRDRLLPPPGTVGRGRWCKALGQWLLRLRDIGPHPHA